MRHWERLAQIYVKTLADTQAKVEDKVVVDILADKLAEVQILLRFHLARNLLRRWVTLLSAHSLTS